MAPRPHLETDVVPDTFTVAQTPTTTAAQTLRTKLADVTRLDDAEVDRYFQHWSGDQLGEEPISVVVSRESALFQADDDQESLLDSVDSLIEQLGVSSTSPNLL